MTETIEKLNKAEIEKQIKDFESDFALENNLEENKKLYQSLFEQGHELTKQRAEKKLSEIKKIQEYKNKLEEIEKIKELRTKLGVTTEEETEVESEPTPEIKLEKIYKSEVYSTEFIKETIKSLLLKESSVKKIEPLKIEGKESEIKINATIEIEVDAVLTTIDIQVKIDATLENKNGEIALKDGYLIEANKHQKKVIKKIAPYLNNIHKYIKKYIENTEDWEIVKMQIENGILKVDFEKDKAEEKIVGK